MSLEVTKEYFCLTHKSGPWSTKALASNGKSIYNFHVERGCNVVEYDETKHRDFGDGLNDLINQITPDIKKWKDERDERIERLGRPIKQIEEYLNTQIKDDPRLVKQLLRVYFSAYTKNPINMAILAPSSDGKTYATVQVSKIFPESDFISVGRLSPTALIHSVGVLVDENGNNIEGKLQELNKIKNTSDDRDEVFQANQQITELMKTSKNLVDLNNKVLLFLDNPNPQTYEVLKPILSHDKEEILYKTTRGDGSLKVKETIIRGWPATIVCSAKNEAKNEVWPEIETRFFMTSPNTGITKYKKANKFTAKKIGLPKWAAGIYDDQNNKKWCSIFVNEIITQIKSKKDYWSPLYDMVAQYFPSNQGVTMRHITRLLSFCNVESMINSDESRAYLSFKDKTNQIVRTYIGTLEDLENSIDVIGNISTIAPEKLKFYDDVFVPLFKDVNAVQEGLEDQQKILEKRGVKSNELAEKYTSIFKKPITTKQINENYLRHLIDGGLLVAEWDEDNRTRLSYYPTNGISIHNLTELKSTFIDVSMNQKVKYDHIISCLKDLLQTSTDFRKSNVFFIKDKQILNLDGLISEIYRRSKEVF